MCDQSLQLIILFRVAELHTPHCGAALKYKGAPADPYEWLDGVLTDLGFVRERSPHAFIIETALL